MTYKPVESEDNSGDVKFEKVPFFFEKPTFPTFEEWKAFHDRWWSVVWEPPSAEIVYNFFKDRTKPWPSDEEILKRKEECWNTREEEGFMECINWLKERMK